MRGYKPLFLTLILLATLLLPVLAMGAPSYGEDDPYLGQVVDSYVNNDSVASTYQVVHNQTLEVMELAYLYGAPMAENFSLYTEVDVGADRITFPNDTCVRHVSLRNEVTYLYEDYGTDAFYEYDVLFEVYVDYEQQYARGIPFMLSNNIGNHKEHFDNVWNHSALFFYRNTATVAERYVALLWWHGGAPPLSKTVFTYEYPLDTWLYIRVRQNATHLSAWIYDDEAMTSLFTFLEAEIEPRNYRYVYSASGYHTTGGNYIDYLNKDMVLFAGYGYQGGHYYTTEMVGGAQVLSLMYNASLPTDTAMTLELSPDNSTWVNHNNQAGYESLVAGLESVDLRDLNTTTLYVRVNMTTTDDQATPRMSQLRLVTVTPISVATVSTAPYLAMSIILLMLGLVSGMRMRR